MRRLGTVGLVAAITACNGGTREVGRAAIERSQPTASNAPRVELASATAAPSDGEPRLVTLSGGGRMAVPGVVGGSVAAPTGALPPSGGFIVRAPRAPSSGTTVATADAVATTPMPVDVPAEPVRRAPPAPPTARPTTTTSSSRGGYAGGAVSHLDFAANGASAAAPVHGHASHHSAAPSRGVADERGFDDFAGRGRVATAPTGGAGYAAPLAEEPPAPAAAVAALPPGTHITVSVSGPTPSYGAAPTVVAPQQQQAPENVLTAATVGDTDRRENYLEYLSRHAGEAELLGLDLSRRVQFRVVDAQNHPVNDATITLSGDGLQAVAHTHADGTWDFYPSVTAPRFAGALTATAQVEHVTARATVNIPSSGDAQGPVVLRVPAVVQPPPPALDLGFLIDVTGSMGDELAYVNREVGNIVQRIEAQSPGVRVRVSATFYRDRGDDIQLQQIPFTNNVPGFADAMRGVSASGGGDYPEDMNAGLQAAMTRLAWSDGPAVRVLVLIADAPPQMYGDEQYTYHTAIADASRRGIRILPVGASGADRTVEYLFRAMGALTSTPYAYLTDDSGVGAPHMEADTDRVGVERFADMLTRLVISDLHGQGMHEPGALGPVG